MQKFHRKPDGTPGKCNATTGKCPYEETPHFDSLSSCQEYCDTLNGTIEFYKQMAKDYYEKDWEFVDKERMDKFLEKYATENLAENPVRLQKDFLEKIRDVYDSEKLSERLMRKTFESELRELKTQCNTLIAEGEKNLRLYEKEYTDLVTKEIGLNSRGLISIPTMERICQERPHETIFLPNSTEIRFRDFTFVRVSDSDYYSLRFRDDSLTPFTVMRTKGKDTSTCKLDEVKQMTDIEKLTYEYNKQSKEHYKKIKNIFKKKSKEYFYAFSRRYKLEANYEDCLNNPRKFEKILDEKGLNYERIRTKEMEQFFLDKAIISFTADGDLIVNNTNHDYFEPKDYFEEYWS